MCSVYMELEPCLGSGGSWIWENVIESKLKGSDFGRTWLKPVPGEQPHKF